MYSAVLTPLQTLKLTLDDEYNVFPSPTFRLVLFPRPGAVPRANFCLVQHTRRVAIPLVPSPSQGFVDATR
jgi:hypothetical protein